jgi:cobalt/nickel transport system permease protein
MNLALRHQPIPDSSLARWDSRWKLAAILFVVCAIAALDRLAPAFAALILGSLLLAVSRLPGRWVRLRLAAFALAALPFVIVLPFTLESDGPGWELGSLHVSEHGLASGLAVFCRCAAIGSFVLLLVGTASLHHTFTAASRLKVPGVLVLLALLAYRYVGAVLVRGSDRAERVADAMRCRGFDGRFHTLAEFHTRPRDVVFFLLAVAFAASLIVWDRL